MCNVKYISIFYAFFDKLSDGLLYKYVCFFSLYCAVLKCLCEIDAYNIYEKLETTCINHKCYAINNYKANICKKVISV